LSFGMKSEYRLTSAVRVSTEIVTNGVRFG
jgi:hypothetical protein